MVRGSGLFYRVLAVSGCLFASALQAADDVDVADPLVVARVGEEPIFRASLDSALQRVGYDRLGADEQKLRVRAEVLDQLVNEQLLRRVIAREGVKATDAEIDAFISQLQTRLAPARVSFDQFLAQSGRDEKALRKHVALEIEVNKLVAGRITAEALEAAYEEHRRQLDGTLVRVSHILLRPDAAQGPEAVSKMLEKAAVIRSEILQGTYTFAEAAARYSAGPSRRKGGDLGYLPWSGTMVEEFSRQVFSLRRSEVSKPFVTPFGVHVAVVTDIQPGSLPAERVRPQVERLLAQTILRELLERERASAAVVYGPGVAHFEKQSGNQGGPAQVVVEPLPVGR